MIFPSATLCIKQTNGNFDEQQAAMLLPNVAMLANLALHISSSVELYFQSTPNKTHTAAK